jgi:hypothetical protein
MAIPLLQNVDEGIVNDAKVISEAPHWNVSEGMVDDAEVDGKALVITCYECVESPVLVTLFSSSPLPATIILHVSLDGPQ